MPDKATFSSDWLGGCAGCHMSLLDMDLRLVELLEKVSLHATPVTDLKHPPKEGVTVGCLEGAVTNTAQEHVCRQMRSRCKVLIAMGDCAVFGGVPAMRNAAACPEALRRAYIETPSTVDGHIPDDPELATMIPARSVGEVVKVDIHLPGCPPSADAIHYVLKELAEGRKPDLKGVHLDWH